MLRLRTAALRYLNGVEPVIDTNAATVKPIPHPLGPAEAADHDYPREYPQSNVERFGDGGGCREAYGARGACSRFGTAIEGTKAPASWTHSIRCARFEDGGDVAERVECAELAPAFGTAIGGTKAPASWTHSIRCARFGGAGMFRSCCG